MYYSNFNNSKFNKVLIKIENLKVGYTINKQDKVLLSDVFLDAVKGETVAIIGVNGAGKSSLLRCVAGLQNPLSGEILINNKNVNYYKSKEKAKKISFVSATNTNVNYLKVGEVVAFGRFPYLKLSGQTDSSGKAIIEKSLELVGMSDFIDKNINEISDGERQKVMIASALAQDTDIILLDEPAAFLDSENKFKIYELLQKLAKENQKSIIYSTHDLDIALNLSDKIWLLKNKSIIQGAPEDLVLNDYISDIFKTDKIYFDIENFNFKHRKNKLFPLKLINKTDEKLIFNITEKALSRNSFFVSENAENPIIIIEKKGNNFVWKLKTKEAGTDFYTIYDLINKVRHGF